jgi:hypothetical protein
MVRRTVTVLAVVLLSLCVGIPASADLAAGTPLFTFTLPTKNTDGTTIPATGTTALKETRFYCDGQATPKKVIAVPGTSWQTAVGDFTGGAHTCQVTVATTGGVESAKSNSLPFVVPTVPAAISDLSVQ